ncbi:MAG: NADH:ubiquinone reductase (Na(+)-transporting) subunit C [Bacteroidales bacterium]|nr:NADH:ubiquinone reductase (Na(+)-transporting) subunit C [Bacteroidales bacterium]MBR2438083.1 NADH:ubiquinone reductase (Na(+)-transporting) subunit C [Bacteroidales bacterium]MBR4088424.1 NADH:ubiquinone reductase (Na(+)-transporting) subunit C [Bacteroidales bacterium]
MDTNKNSYTIIYSIVMVVIVAAVLAFVSLSLKDKQNENISNEKQQYLLASVGLGADANFAEVIKEAIVVDGNGKVINTATSDIAKSEAFNISTSEQTALIKNGAPKEDLRLPVFIADLPDGSKAYIFSAYGAGLWGPIWGWVSLKTDLSTIAGVKFDHSGETPGLGAEIATPRFSSQFAGKEMFNNGEFTSIAIVKGGAKEGSTNEVDAISGGTITSKALDASIRMWMEAYLPYIKSLQALAATPMPIEGEVVETTDNIQNN